MTRLHPYSKEDFLFGVELEWQRFNGQRGSDQYREENDGEVTLPDTVEELCLEGRAYVGQVLWSLTPNRGDTIAVSEYILRHRDYRHGVDIRRLDETDQDWQDCSWVRNYYFGNIRIQDVAALPGVPENFLGILKEHQGRYGDRETGNTRYHLEDIIHTKLESGNDATVTGGEIRCEDPTTYSQTIEAFDHLFRLGEWTIDEECSCHIHLSLPSKRHEYGIHLHKWMIIYLIENMHRVPRCVLPRWAKESWMSSYYQIPDNTEDAQESRYNFIAFRELECNEDDNVHTWEFRCWGNISNVADLTTCMDLSMEAYNYAYDKCHRQRTKCGNQWETIRTMFRHALQSTMRTQRESA